MNKDALIVSATAACWAIIWTCIWLMAGPPANVLSLTGAARVAQAFGEACR